MSICLIAGGTIFSLIPGLDEGIDNNMSSIRNYRYTFDDYIQYLPHVSYYGLSLLGAEAKNNYLDRTIVFGTSGLLVGTTALTLKHTVKRPRPGSGANTSFPSGHTAMAFWGAELVRHEYSWQWGLAAYVTAGTVGFMRMYNNRHWFSDVMAGAGIGILGANIGYILLPAQRRFLEKINGEDTAKDMAIIPYFDGNNAGLYFTMGVF